MLKLNWGLRKMEFGTIDTSWSSIRLALIMIMGVAWVYILNHPGEEDD